MLGISEVIDDVPSHFGLTILITPVARSSVPILAILDALDDEVSTHLWHPNSDVLVDWSDLWFSRR